MFEGIMQEGGKTSSKRVGVVGAYTMAFGLAIACIWFPHLDTLVLGMLGIALGGGALGTLSERKGASNGANR
jgi:hypothetical protein